MKHGSLFSGIGGFDLAAEWMGWENIFHCEWMPFPRQVLKYHFPKSLSYEDITKTDFTIHRGSIDILTGGFPCQPYSSAGKRLGKEDERHLWPHMLRAIQEINPTYVVGENVRGLTNWNGGVVFEEVCADLENCGYEVQPILLPACAVGAPHRRDRIWFIAVNTNSSRFQKTRHKQQTTRFEQYGELDWNATNTNCRRIQSQQNLRQTLSGEKWINGNGSQWNATDSKSICIQGQRNRQRQEQFRRSDWCRFPSQSPICSGDDGIPTKLDGITFSKWRAESIKGYGNAIVPQVAYEIFKVIQIMNDAIPRETN
jgi:DNA (cytosine-5)-methyltransferase 1